VVDLVDELLAARVVRDHHDGLAEVAAQVAQESEDLDGVLRVEIAGRLVGDHDLGIRHDRARDRDALLLAARHLARHVLGALGEADHAQRGARALAPLRSC
jgi:hypothetical protein